jgi:hypothetical protein
MEAAINGEASGIPFFEYGGMQEYHKQAIRKMVEQWGAWSK